MSTYSRGARFAAALVLALVPLPATAGDGPDLAAGYSMLQLDDQTRHGVSGALSFPAFGKVRLWLDAATHEASVDGVDLTTSSLMAGPGLRFGKGRARVFVRAMAGLLRDRASISVFEADISETESGLGVLAGGGVDVRLARRIDLRLQGDYLWRDSEQGESGGVRGGAGFVYRFGAIE